MERTYTLEELRELREKKIPVKRCHKIEKSDELTWEEYRKLCKKKKI
jgi:hypothetical protein